MIYCIECFPQIDEHRACQQALVHITMGGFSEADYSRFCGVTLANLQNLHLEGLRGFVQVKKLKPGMDWSDLQGVGRIENKQ